MSLRVLVTGGSGQVGRSLAELAPADVELVMPKRAELDLADPEALAEHVAQGGFDAVISSGAYTAVDKAEKDVVAAWQVNAMAPAALAVATARAGIPLIQLSTDYVFDGSRQGFYEPADPVAPIGVYGASKEGGEQAVRTANPAHVILRTAWVVSPFGANFVKTMLRLGAGRPKLGVVADQFGCPTSALDIAATLLAILRRLAEPEPPYGTHHFVNAGEASWHELACHIFARAEALGRPAPEVAAIATADYPTPARRPANSRLSTITLQRDFAVTPRPWYAAVDEIVDRLIKDAA